MLQAIRQFFARRILPWDDLPWDYGITLDQGIRDMVHFLRRGGFLTFSSCEGGPGHAFKLPTVRMCCDPGKSVEETRDRLLEVFNVSRDGFTVSTHQEYGYRGDAPSFEFVEIEFWDKELAKP